jgi:alkyldihydroxyacetonephosphate synthase
MPSLPQTPARQLSEITLPESRLGDEARAELVAGLGGGSVRDSAEERASHARGKSYHDLLCLRRGDLSAAPDAVAYPRTADEIVMLLRWAKKHRVAVIPFAGGSSVVGGVTGTPGGLAASVAVDLTKMNRLIEVDDVSMTATAEAGIYGVDLEGALNARGFKHGHHPQSFEFSTLGGWIAARGAGQQSNGYGRAEDWFAGGEIATSKGLWTLPPLPASAAGPDLRAVVAGSEGAFGILTKAQIRIHHLPETSHYSAFLFPDFASGARAIRRIIQSGVPVSTLRLSDPDETYFFQAFAKAGVEPTLKDRLQERFLRLMGMGERPCALIFGIEANRELATFSVGQVKRIIRSCGGLAVGSGPARRWYGSRFHGPYLRDPMMDRGIGIDTLETSTHWSNIDQLYSGVRGALSRAIEETSPVRGGRGLVFTHISHSYVDGASLYFTFLFPRDLDNEVMQWRRIKGAASDAIVRAGGTISHHHGVGEDHVPWLGAEKGAQGMGVLRAIKRELDPAGVLNPGKLVG